MPAADPRPGSVGGPAPAPEAGVWAVVVAAGSGSRFGGPKQDAEIGGRTVLGWSIAAARTVAEGVVVVVAPERELDLVPGADAVVAGGATRSDSVRAGLAAVPAEAQVILVHDAARPAASPDLFAAVVAAVRSGAEAVVPGVAVVDSLRHRDGGAVERDDLVAVQTPQGFAAASLRAAHAGGATASDDASLVEREGGTVVVVPGEPTNVKITHRVDLDAVAAHLAGPGAGGGC